MSRSSTINTGVPNHISIITSLISSVFYSYLFITLSFNQLINQTILRVFKLLLNSRYFIHSMTVHRKGNDCLLPWRNKLIYQKEIHSYSQQCIFVLLLLRLLHDQITPLLLLAQMFSIMVH